MATQTYIPLANFTASTTTTSVTMANINQSYKSLVLVCELKAGSGTAQNGILKLNNFGAGYYHVRTTADGSVTGRSVVNTTFIRMGDYIYHNSSVAGMFKLDILGYSDTSMHTSVLMSAGTENGLEESIHRWNYTTAVTSIVITSSDGSGFAAGSTVALYGIA